MDMNMLCKLERVQALVCLLLMAESCSALHEKKKRFPVRWAREIHRIWGISIGIALAHSPEVSSWTPHGPWRLRVSSSSKNAEL